MTTKVSVPSALALLLAPLPTALVLPRLLYDLLFYISYCMMRLLGVFMH